MKGNTKIIFIGLLMVNYVAISHADVIAVPNADNAAATSITTITQQSVKNNYTLSELTPTIFSQLNIEQQKNIAEQWHLSIEDYTHYLSLMSNTPNGIYYKNRNLDPSWILGFNARDEKEREKYVVVAIQNERARIEKELAFQRDFTRLQQQLYPDLQPILLTAGDWSNNKTSASK
jgi:hypothetical protein